MAFAEDTVRRSEKPLTAFKAAAQMAMALHHLRPEKTNYDKDNPYTFIAFVPDTVENIGLVADLLQTALRTSGDPKLMDRMVSVKDTLGPYSIVIDMPTQDFPLHTVTRQLDRMQKTLQTDWVRDQNGRYRHTKVFEYLFRRNLETRLDPRPLYQALSQSPHRPTDGQFLYLEHDARWGRHDPLKLPTNKPGALQNRGAFPIGLCLTEEDLRELSQKVGFFPQVLGRGPTS